MYIEPDNLSPITTSPLTTTNRNPHKKEMLTTSNRQPLPTFSSESIEGEKWESLELSGETSKKTQSNRDQFAVEYEEVATEKKQIKKRKQHIQVHPKNRDDCSVDELQFSQPQFMEPLDAQILMLKNELTPLSLTMSKVPKLKNLPRLATTLKAPLSGIRSNFGTSNIAKEISPLDTKLLKNKDLNINSPHNITTNNYNFNFQKPINELAKHDDIVGELRNELQKASAEISNMNTLLELRNDKIAQLEQQRMDYVQKQDAYTNIEARYVDSTMQTEYEDIKLKTVESQLVALKLALKKSDSDRLSMQEIIDQQSAKLIDFKKEREANLKQAVDSKALLNETQYKLQAYKKKLTESTEEIAQLKAQLNKSIDRNCQIKNEVDFLKHTNDLAQQSINEHKDKISYLQEHLLNSKQDESKYQDAATKLHSLSAKYDELFSKCQQQKAKIGKLRKERNALKESKATDEKNNSIECQKMPISEYSETIQGNSQDKYRSKSMENTAKVIIHERPKKENTKTNSDKSEKNKDINESKGEETLINQKAEINDLQQRVNMMKKKREKIEETLHTRDKCKDKNALVNESLNKTSNSLIDPNNSRIYSSGNNDSSYLGNASIKEKQKPADIWKQRDFTPQGRINIQTQSIIRNDKKKDYNSNNKNNANLCGSLVEDVKAKHSYMPKALKNVSHK